MRKSAASLKGFTLVELMVVVTILAILSALITSAVMAALNHAKEVMVSTEIRGLSSAVMQYRAEFGEYPPDFSSATKVEAHLRSRFPRITQAEIDTIKALPIGHSEALLFWLTAFGNSPTNPYTSGGPRDVRVSLDPNHISGTQPYRSYYPAKNSSGTNTSPVIYFVEPYAGVMNTDGKKPYKLRRKVGSETEDTYAGNGYQLIWYGFDDQPGGLNIDQYTSTGENFTLQDNDNITNFSKAATLGDDLP